MAAAAVGLIRMRVVGSGEPEFWSIAWGELDEATLGKFFDTTPIHKRKPVDQLRFWQPRITRILAEHSRDAELHSAAALIYDQPSALFAERAVSEVLQETQDTWTVGELTFQKIRNWIRPYDQSATPLSQKLAQRVIELEPENPQWHRLRAAIATTPLLYPSDAMPRSAEMSRFVKEASTIDAQNGIYGLLLAANMMKDAIELNSELSGPDFVFKDRSAAVEATELALQEIEKPVLLIGEPGLEGLTRIHELAGHPTRGTMESIISRSTTFRMQSNIIHLIRSMLWAGEIEEHEGNSEEALRFFNACNLTCKALSGKGGDAFFFRTEFFMFRELSLQGTIRIQQPNPKSVTSQELREVGNALQAMKPAIAAKPPNTRNQVGPWLPIILTMVAGSTLFGLLASLPLLIFLLVLARPSIDWKIDAAVPLACIVTLLFTGFFLGAGPAGQVTTNTQDWVALLSIIAVILVFIMGCVIRLGKRPQFRIKSLLLGCLVAALVIQVLRLVDLGLPPAFHFAPDWRISAAAATGQSATDWIPGPEFWSSSLMQWMLQDGPAMTVWCTIALLCLIGFVRGRFRESLEQSFVSVLLLSLIAFTTWVWAYPSMLPMIKGRNDEIRMFLSKPNEYYAELRTEYERQLKLLSQTTVPDAE